MSEVDETLYAKLLGETARIQWSELQPFFARGALMWVAPGQDLVAIAVAIAENRAQDVQAWLQQGVLRKLDDDTARRLAEQENDLWAVVLAPWVLVQDRFAQRERPQA
ncbi:DUF2288 domain-containing protein [Pseudomonas matsuisoli]|nr:DUF2288 domain-containing protein [Pseudomonas matsuisoli]